MDTDITFSFEVDGNKYALIFSEYSDRELLSLFYL